MCFIYYVLHVREWFIHDTPYLLKFIVKADEIKIIYLKE